MPNPAPSSTTGTYRRGVGLFFDTNEDLELTNGTVYDNIFRYIGVHGFVGQDRVSEIKTVHPNALILAYQNFASFIQGPHQLSMPSSMVSWEEVVAHGPGSDRWYLIEPTKAISSVNTGTTPPTFTTSVAHTLSMTGTDSLTPDWVEIQGNSNSAYNGIWRCKTVPSSTTVTFENGLTGVAMSNAGAGSGGTISKIGRYCDYGYLFWADLSKTSLRAIMGQHFATLKSWGFDGIFADDVNTQSDQHCWVDGMFQGITTADAYRTATIGAISALGSSASSNGLILVPNLGVNPWDTASNNAYKAILDTGVVTAAVREFWHAWNTGVSSAPFTGATWAAVQGQMPDAQTRGVDFIANSYELSPVDHYRSIDYGLSSWYLDWDGTSDSAFGYDDMQPTSATIYGRYRLLGAPVGTKQVLSGKTYAFTRQFQNGIVAVNAEDTGELTFNLGGPYQTLEGTTVSSVNLFPGRGQILLSIPYTPPVTPAEPNAWWLPTGAQNPNNHQTSDVLRGLTGKYGVRGWDYRYELLDANLNRKMDLYEVTGGKVVHQYLADIKRQATFTIRDFGRINYLSDKIRVWIRLLLPPWGTNDWVEWPLGVFNLISPTRHANEYDVVEREVEGFDMLQELQDDVVSSRYAVAAGANVVNTAYNLVSFVTPKWKITRSTETLTAAKEWPPGTSKLVIANNLLAIAGFESLSFDGRGTGIIKPYQPPEQRPVTWTYEYGLSSLMIPDVDQELDLFSVPNKIVAVVSEPDQPMLVASATNSNPASPTSTVRRGRTIVEVLEEVEATSQSVLNSKVSRALFERAQIYEHLTFTTSVMPFHGTNDILWIDYDPLAINAKYSETSWEIELEAGAPMRHEARRLVSV